MKEILKARLRALAGDESGVAFALTVTVSLVIFLFGFAVYAVGETVRQRIELQNAADAAAYSGALVQADTVSRIAVINKAMAFDYVMMTRRQMDHIMDAWFDKVLQHWQNSCNVTRNYQFVCACHPRFEGVNWRCGVMPGGGGGEVSHMLIRLNGSQDALIPVIMAARSAQFGRNTVAQLESLRRCVSAMDRAERELISGMKSRIEKAVEFAVDADVSLTENDRKFKNKRKITHHIYNLKPASAYFEALKGDESRFLNFGGFSGAAANIFGTGADTWLKKQNADGFRRDYVQSGSTLSAHWFTYNQIWAHIKVCIFGGIVVQDAGTVTADMARDRYFTGETAKPQVLKRNFFGPDGAVVVGVSRPLNNPLGFVYRGDKGGIYSAFEVGGGSQTMWAVSAARAGYRLKGWRKGEYRNRGGIANEDNLCVADWDAEFLPVGDTRLTASSSLLDDLASKLGAGKSFVGRDHFSSRTTLDLYDARTHLHH